MGCPSLCDRASSLGRFTVIALGYVNRIASSSTAKVRDGSTVGEYNNYTEREYNLSDMIIVIFS